MTALVTALVFFSLATAALAAWEMLAHDTTLRQLHDAQARIAGLEVRNEVLLAERDEARARPQTIRLPLLMRVPGGFIFRN
jgi:hypothetical protein